MFYDNDWISNDYKKILNPAKCENIINAYQGHIPHDFNFKSQSKNFYNIFQSLEQFQIYPKEIYYGEKSIQGEKNSRTTFVVTFSNPNLLWHKYEGNVCGSGQNYIYWKKRKINTTSWVKLSHDDINAILNDA